MKEIIRIRAEISEITNRKVSACIPCDGCETKLLCQVAESPVKEKSDSSHAPHAKPDSQVPGPAPCCASRVLYVLSGNLPHPLSLCEETHPLGSGF